MRKNTKIRALSLLLALLMVLGLLPGTAMAAEGEDAILISTAEELAAFRDRVNSGENTLDVVLTADIELSGDWTPFNPNDGYVASAYAGTFDGNGHTISGLSVNATAANQGLFGVINGATIKNLKIEGHVTSSNNYVGGIVGKIQQGTIENCSFSGGVTTTKSGSYAGGIAGYAGNTASQTAVITGCVNMSNVTGEARGVVGGIVGYAKYTTIENCYNTGLINGASRSGGIAGQLQNNCTATNCYNRGDLQGSGTASDIADFLYSSSQLSNCYYITRASGAGTGIAENCEQITSADGLASKLGSAFTTDANNINGGWPILAWQAGAALVPKDPKITITGGSALYMTNSGVQPTGTLTVNYQDTEPIPVTWNITDGGDIIELSDPNNVDANKSTQTVSILKAGKATVTATAGGYSDEIEITVWPFITTVEISGNVAVDETVKAKINVLGGGELDYDVFPVMVQWRCKDTTADTTWKNIQTGQELVIPADMEGKHLSFTFRYQNEDKFPSSPSLVRPAGTVTPDPQPPVTDKTLEDALKWYTMSPVSGRDTNVNKVLEQYLASQKLEGFIASVKKVEEVYGGAGIADNGDITYFYVNPNTTPAIRSGSYKVTFTLVKDGQTQEATVPVTVYWDVDKVTDVMREEISSKVVLDTTAPVTEDLSLPKVIDDKRWTLISWQSSDENVISISGKNQSTADTLFDPYVGVVKRGQADQQVTLTATFNFQLTNNGEAPITLVNTYSVTVKALDASQEEQIRIGLLAKLDAGFEKAGITDAVIGERLTPDANGVYTATNDIQLPTTRDFGVDGKYYPVTITTSNSEVLKAPDVNNAARVEVYRPGPSQENTEGTITVTLHDKDTSVTASRTFQVKVPALTQEEINRELALMERVKAAYFDGLKGNNTTKDNVRTDLTPFFEVYEQDGKLVWVHTNSERIGRGIVPVPIEGWEDLELWRLFKSSNPNVISHENLIVTRQTEAKAVTITSRLSSKTLGRYGALYLSDPYRYAQYAGLDKLYYQEVTTSATAQPEARRMARAAQVQGDMIVVRGTRDPESAIPVTEVLNNVSFSLIGLDGTVWIAPTTLSNLDESSTVYDVFTRMLTDNGCTATRVKGTYIKAISGPHGALAEKEYGDDSGWMYRVNGRIPDIYMGACPLHSGDTIQVFYTRDAKKDDPNYSRPSGGNSSGGSSSGGNSPSGGKTEQPNQPLVKVETSGHGDTYIVTLPKASKGPQLVTIPNVKQGQLVVVVHADGREVVIKKAILEEGRAKFLLEQNASVKVVNYTNPFSDVNSSAWYASAVDFAAGRELFAGVSQNAFAPSLPLSRGMLATVLFRLEDAGTQKTESVFADVAKGAWYEQGIAWAAEAGIVSGYGGGRFGPNDEITREQLAVMLFRYAQLLNMSTGGRDSLTGFSDTASVSPWAQDAVAWAVDSGIISGLPNGMLAPSRITTRAEAAAMLQRFVSVLLK